MREFGQFYNVVYNPHDTIRHAVTYRVLLNGDRTPLAEGVARDINDLAEMVQHFGIHIDPQSQNHLGW